MKAVALSEACRRVTARPLLHLEFMPRIRHRRNMLEPPGYHGGAVGGSIEQADDHLWVATLEEGTDFTVDETGQLSVPADHLGAYKVLCRDFESGSVVDQMFDFMLSRFNRGYFDMQGMFRSTATGRLLRMIPTDGMFFAIRICTPNYTNTPLEKLIDFLQRPKRNLDFVRPQVFSECMV